MPGITVDSGEYLAVAESLASGDGFTMPYISYDELRPVRLRPRNVVQMTSFPPLYPALTGAAVKLTGADPLVASRWLNAALFGGTIFLFVGVVASVGLPARWLLVLALLLLSPGFVFAHARALSEPLLLFTIMAAIWAIVRYLEAPSRGRLAAVVLAAGVAPLVRYAGIGVALGAAASVAIASHGSARQRAARAAAVTLAGAIPVATWFTIVGRDSSVRTIAWHPPELGDVELGVSTIGGWLGAGETWRFEAGSIALAVGVVMFTKALRRRSHPPSLSQLCLYQAAAYALVVLATKTLADANMPFDARVLLPIHLLVVMAAAVRLPRWNAPWRRRAYFALVAIAAAGVGSTMFSAGNFSGSSASGYAARRWQTSPTIAYLSNLPMDTLIITNAPDAIWLHTRREPVLLPLRLNAHARRPNEHYSSQMKELARFASSGEAVVIFFDRPTSKHRRAIREDVINSLRLSVDRRLPDGTLYRVGL